MTSSLQQEIAALRARIDELARQAKETEQQQFTGLPSGTVLKFTKRFEANTKSYSFAALKIGDTWSTTSGTRSADNFNSFMSSGVSHLSIARFAPFPDTRRNESDGPWRIL